MSNYLRKLGVFHTPLSISENASLTGNVINTNGLNPIRLNGDRTSGRGCLCNKMNVLQDTIMELGIDVLHITKTHDSREKLPLHLTMELPLIRGRQQSTRSSHLHTHGGRRGIQQHKCVAGESGMGKQGNVANHSLLSQ